MENDLKENEREYVNEEMFWNKEKKRRIGNKKVVEDIIQKKKEKVNREYYFFIGNERECIWKKSLRKGKKMEKWKKVTVKIMKTGKEKD